MERYDRGQEALQRLFHSREELSKTQRWLRRLLAWVLVPPLLVAALGFLVLAVLWILHNPR